MLIHVFYVTDFQESPWTLWTECFVVEAFQMNSLWVWCSLFSCHLQSQIIHHKLLLRFRDFTTTCVAFFLIQDSFDLECCCVALCCVSRALTHKSHKLCCCDAPATPEFIITGSFAARPDLVKRSVCVCWLFRNVRSYCSPPDLVVPSRLRIHPENVCGAEAIVSRSPLTHSSVNASVCVCCFWCWGVCIGN